MCNHYGRAEGGARANADKPKDVGARITMIAALGLDGVVAALYGEWATDEIAFMTFITEHLIPQLEAGQIVVMDNASFHKGKSIENVIKAAGAKLVYLPPYSPDLSPIENMWSKIKKLLKNKASRTLQSFNKAITEAFKEIRTSDIFGWYEHCGYCVN